MSENNSESRIRFLQSHALFGGLTDEQILPVLALLRDENFAPGEIIVSEGEPGDRMHFILSGTASVFKDATPDIPDDDACAALSVMKPGDAFGEMALIDVQARSASVRALAPMETLSLSNRDLHKLYKTHPELFTMIILNIARELSRRLRRADAKLTTSAAPGAKV